MYKKLKTVDFINMWLFFLEIEIFNFCICQKTTFACAVYWVIFHKISFQIQIVYLSTIFIRALVIRGAKGGLANPTFLWSKLHLTSNYWQLLEKKAGSPAWLQNLNEGSVLSTEILPEIIEWGPLSTANLFLIKSVAYSNPK